MPSTGFKRGWLWVFLGLVICFGNVKRAFSQDSTFYVGSIGGTVLGDKCIVGSEKFHVRLIRRTGGLPWFKMSALITRNAPNTFIRVTRGSLFHFFGSYFEVTEIVPPKKSSDGVGYVGCKLLSGRPTKGHITNLPKKGEVVPKCDDSGG